MVTETCSKCKIEKHINKFYKKYSECRDCNRAEGLKRYYGNKDRISYQQKSFMKKLEIEYYYRNKSIDVFKLET